VDEEKALEKSPEFLKDLEFNEKELEGQQEQVAVEDPSKAAEVAAALPASDVPVPKEATPPSMDAPVSAAAGGFIDISRHPLLSKRSQRQKIETVSHKRTSSFLEAAARVHTRAICLRNPVPVDFRLDPTACGDGGAVDAITHCCTGAAPITCPALSVVAERCCTVPVCPAPFVQAAARCKPVCQAPMHIPCLRNRLCVAANRECYNLKKKLILSCGLGVLGLVGLIVGAILTAGAAAVLTVPLVTAIASAATFSGVSGIIGTLIAIIGITDQNICPHDAPPPYFKVPEVPAL